LADIEASDLTHVYLTLKVWDTGGELAEGGEDRAAAATQTPGVLRLTLPQCHVLLRALGEFEGLIELTTPVMEEAKRLKARKAKPLMQGSGHTETDAPQSLDSLIERLNPRGGDHPAQAEA